MEPEDLAILIKVETQLKNKVRLTSLETLCARQVAENLLWYYDQGLTLFLPTSLCTLVFKKVLSKVNSIEFEKETDDIDNPCDRTEYSRWDRLLYRDRLKIFSLLEKAGLKEFDCSFWTSWVDSGLVEGDKKLHERLAKGCPQLATFKDHRGFDSTAGLLSDHYSLKFMSKLVVLEITEYPATDVDLQVISLFMPLLKSLTLSSRSNPDDFTYDGLRFLTDLKKLEHLIFISRTTGLRRYQSSNNVSQKISWSLHLLPHLKTIAEKPVHSIFGARHNFPSYKVPVELGLEHLVVWPGTQIPPNVSLPNVTEVTIYNAAPQSDASFFLQFKKLRHLNCRFMPLSEIFHVLLLVGSQLTQLLVSDCPNKGDLMRILQLCPNLLKLSLAFDLLEDNFEVPQMINSVRLLKSFSLNVFEDEVESRNLLHLLLTSCPDLEELRLCRVQVTKSEMDLINKDMDAGTLTTQKLQQVFILEQLIIHKDAVLPFADFVAGLCLRNCTIFKAVNFDCFCRTNPSKRELVEKLEEAIQGHIHSGL